jgi:hypothetical protein
VLLAASQVDEKAPNRGYGRIQLGENDSLPIGTISCQSNRQGLPKGGTFFGSSSSKRKTSVKNRREISMPATLIYSELHQHGAIVAMLTNVDRSAHLFNGNVVQSAGTVS